MKQNSERGDKTFPDINHCEMSDITIKELEGAHLGSLKSIIFWKDADVTIKDMNLYMVYMLGLTFLRFRGKSE